MYEDKTYEAILQEKLARVASSLDKREGSIIFDALAPNSLESAMIYVALDTVLNETFADTASRDYLISAALSAVSRLCRRPAPWVSASSVWIFLSARASPAINTTGP